MKDSERKKVGLKIAVSNIIEHMFAFIRKAVSFSKHVLKPYICPVCLEYASEPVCPQCAIKLRPLIAFAEHFPLLSGTQTHMLSDAVFGSSPQLFASSQLDYERWLCKQISAGNDLLPVRSLYWLNAPMKKIVNAFKYGGRGDLAGWLISSGLLNNRSLTSELMFCTDLICNVPAQSDKMKLRTYDPVSELAAYLARSQNKPLSLKSMRSDNLASEQKFLNRNDRYAKADSKFGIIDDRMVKDKRILLVDDVCTTGATLINCSNILTNAGARSVHALTVARTPLKINGKSISGPSHEISESAQINLTGKSKNG